MNLEIYNYQEKLIFYFYFLYLLKYNLLFLEVLQLYHIYLGGRGSSVGRARDSW